MTSGIGVGPLRLSEPCEVVWVERSASASGSGTARCAGHLFGGEEASWSSSTTTARSGSASRRSPVPARWWVRAVGPAAGVASARTAARLARAVRRAPEVRGGGAVSLQPRSAGSARSRSSTCGCIASAGRVVTLTRGARRSLAGRPAAAAGDRGASARLPGGARCAACVRSRVVGCPAGAADRAVAAARRHEWVHVLVFAVVGAVSAVAIMRRSERRADRRGGPRSRREGAVGAGGARWW